MDACGDIGALIAPWTFFTCAEALLDAYSILGLGLFGALCYGVYTTFFHAKYAVLIDASQRDALRESLRAGRQHFGYAFALLPLINGLFDFFSFGATRYFLRIGARQRGVFAPFWALVDLLIGAALFVMLGCASVLAVYVARTGDGNALIDLGDLFARISADPHAFWWLYATFFSTLLPTILHLFIAATALFDGAVTAVAPRVDANLTKAIEDKHVDAAVSSLRWLAAGQTFGVVATVFTLWTALWALLAHGQRFAGGLFEMFAVFARLIGAI